MLNDFVEIDNILINKDIASTNFTCDLKACKGACCTMPSEFGAPLLKEEINIIDNILDVVYEYLPETNVKMIKKSRYWEDKFDTLMVKSIKKRDCVFAIYENEVAKCSIEKAYFDKRIEFRKPISCHLFPIRINDFGGAVLRYEEYDECAPALKKGLQTKISVLEFCKEALERAYGINFYQKLIDKMRS
jgi:hypothetical protein